MSDRIGWEEALPRYDKPHLRLRQVAALVRDLSPSGLVDLGCATGHLRSLLPGVEYRGCDFVAPETPPDFPFYACDFNQAALPEEIGGEELIVCSGILEYMEDLSCFLRSVYKRLRPGGHLVATYFNMNHVSRRWTRLRRGAAFVHPDWRGFYSPREITALFEDAGLMITRRIAMNHSLGNSPPVEATIDWPLKLPAVRFWSPWLAHQFLYVSKRPVSPEESP